MKVTIFCDINIKALFFCFTLSVSLICACSKNEIEEKWAEEEKKLAEWIKENKPDLVISNGIYFEKTGKEYSENIQPEVGDYVLIDFKCSFLSDGTVEEVSYKDWQKHEALYPSTFKEGGPELWMPERWASMGIGQMHENEQANVYVPSRLLGLQDFKTRVYEINLKKVIDTDLKTYQEKLMECCMKKYRDNVDTVTITDNGKDYYVLYHIEREGFGADVINAISVKTHTSEYYYMQNDDSKTCFTDRERIGCNDNVSKFHQKISEMFSLETRSGTKLKKGGRIIAVMPYKIMYGDKLNKDSDTGQYIAPEHSVLKYEINIDN